MESPCLDRFVALDVEIARRTPLTVCAIAAARYEDGEETSYCSSLVNVTGNVRYTDIHGLTRADLRDAPSWGIAWKQVATMLADVEIVVAYRAAFDRSAVMTMCARHAMLMPRVRFFCAAAMFESRFGQARSLTAALRHVGMPFPGRPHDPLADARAAAALALKLRALPAEGAVIQLSQNPNREAKTPRADDPATLH